MSSHTGGVSGDIHGCTVLEQWELRSYGSLFGGILVAISLDRRCFLECRSFVKCLVTVFGNRNSITKSASESVEEVQFCRVVCEV